MSEQGVNAPHFWEMGVGILPNFQELWRKEGVPVRSNKKQLCDITNVMLSLQLFLAIIVFISVISIVIITMVIITIVIITVKAQLLLAILWSSFLCCKYVAPRGDVINYRGFEHVAPLRLMMQ